MGMKRVSSRCVHQSPCALSLKTALERGASAKWLNHSFILSALYSSTFASLYFFFLLSNPPALHIYFFPVCLSSFPQSNFPFFILVLMPRAVATAWNGSCLLNASPGELAVPAAQCGLSPWQRGHMPLAQLSVPLPPWWLLLRKKKREGVFSFLTILSPSLNIQH